MYEILRTEELDCEFRSVFEKVLGSGVWWINYRDAEGERHCEKVGTYAAAGVNALFQKQLEIRIGMLNDVINARLFAPASG